MNGQTKFLQELLNRPWASSKKFLMASAGLSGIAVMYFASFIGMLFSPGLASAIAGVAVVAIPTFGTLAGLCIGVQGWQDSNTATSLDASMKSDNK